MDDKFTFRVLVACLVLSVASDILHVILTVYK
mgnify:CR=1 FL=1